MAVPHSAIVKHIGIETIVAVVIRVVGIVGGIFLDALAVDGEVFIHIVLSGNIGAGSATEIWRSRLAVEFMTILGGEIAIVGMLHFPNRLATVFGEENLAVTGNNLILSGALDRHQGIDIEVASLVVFPLGSAEHSLDAVVGESEPGSSLIDILEMRARSPEICLSGENVASALAGATCVVRSGLVVEICRRKVGFLDNKIDRFLERGTREFGLGLVDRLVGALEEKRTAIHAEQQIIIVGTEEVSLAEDAILVRAIGNFALVLEETVDTANLGVVFQPHAASAVGDFLLAALEDVAIVALIPVASAHSELVGVPGFIFAPQPLHQCCNKGGEAIIHVAIPTHGVFIEEQFAAPDYLFRQFVVWLLAEQVVATCSRREHHHGGNRE